MYYFLATTTSSDYHANIKINLLNNEENIIKKYN